VRAALPPGIDVRIAHVTGIDLERRRVHTDSDKLDYDYAVPAAGSAWTTTSATPASPLTASV